MKCEFTTQVSLLVDDELKETDEARVRAHIENCAECREAEKDFGALSQRIKRETFLPDAYAAHNALNNILTAPSAITPCSVQQQPPLRALFQKRGFAFACAVLCAAFMTGLIIFILRPTANMNARRTASGSEVSSWEVVRIEGAPQINSNRITDSGRLAVGAWLETDNQSRARVDVASIGHVEVDPNSRLRLVETNSNEHRLALARGTIHALISAPPRLFFVDTPSAVAVDYGCAYTLEVDDAGRSLLHVTAGWVALEAHGRESFVPAGAVCATEPGKLPGTPYFNDAPVTFVRALATLDSSLDDSAAFNIVLNQARKRDALTLWHLLSRVERQEPRERVYQRLAALVPPPKGVTTEGVMRLDREMLERWKETFELAWYEKTN